ncbi:MAG: hypothetical protein UX20_C0029G0019 [Candidatus Magasanikbacteria bacterium GW2011_GWC2_45_8]|uniref:D-alanine-D-alanine ligase n=1 Tax=Candidatus Magasanikbacteria bacterium GW2011_GWC2_45_8 TaxID=1619050 RepID=A0A0G1MY92_9BACT|nr:MAG: hypothetical protein UX20_C0029G0019 [Candidatus Magasanikbacteria bacterium GW2011_GWC2_45_8]
MGSIIVPVIGAIASWFTYYAFGVPWWAGALSIPLIMILSVIGIHATALTSVTPVGALSKITQLSIRAFRGLHHKDWAKFDVRVEDETGIPYFTDSNPNTAFGPDLGLPMTEVLALHGVRFDEMLASLLSKYARAVR